MPIVLAGCNQKGGCGKTTTIMNLAGGLQKAGYKVLVIDADRQLSATKWSIEQGQDSLAFDVMPARQLQGRQLSSFPHDILLVDCPPGVADPQTESNRFAQSVIRIADAILVPLMPSRLDFRAAGAFVHYLEKEKPPETKTAVLINARQHTLLGREARATAQLLFAPIEGAVVLESTIGRRAPITEVSGSGVTIFEYAPKHEAAREYTALTKEIIQWLSAPASQQTT